ncbi:S8 family serine peptidase [Cellvibrio fontiphilus]|uniref:S8 family serine peptidase n=1 Tax=Cellvibrio fontiphilus TaxID=1815559 RepID=A0ABV7FGX0_9GAMM
MKPFYRRHFRLGCLRIACSSLVLACLCQPVAAQLLERLPVDTTLDGVTRELDDTVRQVQESVQKDLLEESVLRDALIQPVDTALAKAPALVPDLLSAVLPIVDRRGATVLVDVKVEDGWRAVEREWLLLVDQTALAELAKLDVEIIEQTRFAGLGLQLVRFRVPAALDSRAALRQRLPASLHPQLDRNHIYSPQTAAPQSSQPASSPISSTLPPQAPACVDDLSIGIIDTAIDSAHPAFAGVKIRQQDFIGADIESPKAHGTAVAGLLVGKGDELQPLLPGATLYAASVFYPRNDYTQGATMMNLVRALNWLTEQKVPVINMSLTGPDNSILAQAIARVIAAGSLVVAAAGNEGPAAPPLYPAAYKGVIAVTAVDQQQRPYRWANRGDHIAFAALGVSVVTARSAGGYGRESGTSMAAPLVSALVACELATTPAETVMAQLIKRAQDLGAPGRDPIFGHGQLQRHQNVAFKVSEARVSE